MKLRCGFVSNSSSSSFFMLGVETTLDAITPAALKKAPKGFVTVVQDDRIEWGEGSMCVFIKNMEMLNAFKASGLEFDSVWKIVECGYDGEIHKVSRKLLTATKGDLVMWTDTIDQHSPETPEQLKDWTDMIDEDGEHDDEA